MSLEITNLWIQAIIAIAAVFAVGKYFTDKKRDQALFVVEQLNFFRTDILSQFEFIVKHICDKKPNYNFNSQRVGYIENFSYSWVYMNYRNEVRIQSELNKDKIIGSDIIKMLNTMEQFPWSIILHKTNEHPALYVVHESYIQFVEQFSHQILFLKFDNPKQFEGIKKIYSEWAPKIIRKSNEEKLEQITKEAQKLKDMTKEN